ncbi:follistatin-like [Rhopilema esculentum]|uniref:follistatin-like n=1 Tax=Rhopilema esculentum TaxID=499914 RepID=UPI0031D3F1C7
MHPVLALLTFGLLSATNILFQGPVPKTTDTHCETICTDSETEPVCGNDWKTYESECELRKEACRTSTPLISVYKGRCRSTLRGTIREDGTGDRFGCIRIKCNYRHEPVCGSDLQRYSNPCNLNKRACFSRTPIVKVMDVPRTHFGECSDLRCPVCEDPLPLELSWCGNDRVTYPTACHMMAAACNKRTAIVPLYAGRCIETEE